MTVKLSNLCRCVYCMLDLQCSTLYKLFLSKALHLLSYFPFKRMP